MRDIQFSDKDDRTEYSGSEFQEQELEEFRRGLFERYGEKIALKRQNAYYSKKISGSFTEQEQRTMTDSVQTEEETFTVRRKEQKEQEKTETVYSRESGESHGDRMSSFRLILGILAVFGLILFFFL